MLRKSLAGERRTPGSSPGVTIERATTATPLPKKKSPAFRRDLPALADASFRTSARSAVPGWASGPDDWDPAAADRASVRRPAAGRASDPGSDSAGPGSGSG